MAGDATEPLRDQAVHAAAFDGRDVVGVAARFDGFSTPSLSVAADTAEVADGLIEAVRAPRCLLSVAVDQPLPSWSERLTWSVDPWLRAACEGAARDPRAERVDDPAELADYYRRVNVRYWSPAMLQEGGSFVIRDGQGGIAAAVSVQFVLRDARYAQIGALATAPALRRQGLARTLLSTTRASLASAGVRWCGVFADAGHPWLADCYERLGFVRAGAFRFADI